MSSRAPEIILKTVFGASLHQVGLDATLSNGKFILEWINYLTNQDLTKWAPKLLHDRFVANIIKENRIYKAPVDTPNDAFNYLIIILDRLPHTLDYNNDLVLGDRDPTNLSSLEGEVAVALLELREKIKQSSMTEENKESFEKALIKSLSGKQALEPTISVDKTNVFDKLQVLRDIERSIPTERTYTDCCKMELRTSLVNCQIKLRVARKYIGTIKRAINPHHYGHFASHLQKLREMITTKDKMERKRLFESQYLFIEVQKLVIAMQYHLDIFVHYLLKEVDGDWLKDEDTQQQFNESVASYKLEEHARNFWSQLFGIDKIIVQREMFSQKFKEHCPGASVFSDDEYLQFLLLLDKFGTGFVTIFTYANMMHSFGNNMLLVQQAINLPGFVGNIGFEGSKLLISKNQYLVQFDSRLTVVHQFLIDNSTITIQYFTSVLPVNLFVTPPLPLVTVTERCVSEEPEIPNGYNPDPIKPFTVDNLQQIGQETAADYQLKPFDAFPTRITEGFIGDLTEKEVPILPESEYVFRLSSQKDNITITFGRSSKELHLYRNIRLAVNNNKITLPITVGSSDYDGWSNFFREYTQCSLTKPFVPNHQVYHTEYDRQKANIMEVDGMKLHKRMQGENSSAFDIPRLVKKAYVYFECVGPLKEIHNALVRNETLTDLDLHLSEKDFSLLTTAMFHPNIKTLFFNTVANDKLVFGYPTTMLEDLLLSLPKLETLEVDDGRLLDVAKKLTSLKRLVIKNVNGMMDPLEYFYTEHPSVTALNSWSIIPELHTWCKLKELTVCNSEFLITGIWSDYIQKLTVRPLIKMGAYCSLIKRFRNLKELEMPFESYFTGEQLHVIRISPEHIRELYEAKLDFKCNLYHHPLKCQIWKTMTSTSLYWSPKASAPCCTNGECMSSDKSKNPEIIDEDMVQKLQRIEHLRICKIYKSKLFMENVFNWLPQLTNLKSLLIKSSYAPEEYVISFLGELPKLTSLQVLRLNLSATETKVLINYLPHLKNLLALEVTQKVLFRSEYWGIIDVYSGVLQQKFSYDKTLAYHEELAYKRRLDLTSEIQDWIAVVSNIVRCQELFAKLPLEIWEQIFSFFKYSPYLDTSSAFKQIFRSKKKVVKVVDWDIIKHTSGYF